MADENTLTPVEINEEEQDEALQKIEKPYGFIELCGFGPKSALKDFTYWNKGYSTYTALIEHLKSLGKNNAEEIVMGWINGFLSSNARAKATNAAPRDLDSKENTKKLIDEAVTKGETLLTTEDEAEKYIPGVRERYALGFFQRAYQEARKNYTENKTEENRKKFIEAGQALAKAQEEDMARQLAEAEAAASTPAPAQS